MWKEGQHGRRDEYSRTEYEDPKGAAAMLVRGHMVSFAFTDPVLHNWAFTMHAVLRFHPSKDVTILAKHTTCSRSVSIQELDAHAPQILWSALCLTSVCI